jgi:hypothetical protein
MASPRASRVSNRRITADLRLAARRGDRAALTVAVDQMKTLALSPRYWERYLLLLGNPLARLVDLLVIKQGERIAHQKGWKLARTGRAARKRGGLERAPQASRARRAPAEPGRSSKPPARGAPRRGHRTRPGEERQPTLFDLG